ncbi:uncharacterized protein K489DRAFT_383275 [Dissoconium aciculare CBS 342.82]|jgi:hypothetical protein|uniref:Uncharacterized protein n=1 Tax=Dissoconium aciculare CBS 342.82 TaxID=1314786 RepID=A0A6J3LVK3_9PEZI|nr:uncharacterized protein K489DRAFT_383275 [Dissoconium aciculare CBS 342.82]KAF1819708.1 hypothetical protein K489DRAFT_383275 [Dissoconium aciculare CBS 342.82]
MGVFLNVYTTPSPEIVLDEDTRATLAGIEELMTIEPADTEATLGVYTRALAGLETAFRAAAIDPRDFGHRLGWVREYDARPMADRVEARDAVALVLMAHWAAALADWRDVWWEHGLGKAIVEDVVRCLPERLRGYVAWPIRRCGL